MIVVDSAAVVDALAAAPGTAELRGLLAAEELHAPTLLDFEVVSALRGLTRGGHLSEARAFDLLTDLDQLAIHRWPAADELRRRTFQLRDTMSAYDGAYVALAEALACPLLTRDQRLARAGGHAVRVVVG